MGTRPLLLLARVTKCSPLKLNTDLMRGMSNQMDNRGKQQDQLETLRHTSRSLFRLGTMRLAADKTATNTYLHFTDPTVVSETMLGEEKLVDFKEIHSVVLNYGRPEVADQMSGAIYMHANMEEDKCSQCLRLADDARNYSINQLQFCLSSMSWWSSEAKDSLILTDLVHSLDITCIDRLNSLHFSLEDQMRLAYKWRCLLFAPPAKFPLEMLSAMSPFVLQSSLPVLVSFLLLLSTEPLEEDKTDLMKNLTGTEVAHKLTPAISLLAEAELLACFLGIRRLGGEGEEIEVIGKYLESKFGYRL